jgi:hypothetical protein
VRHLGDDIQLHSRLLLSLSLPQQAASAAGFFAFTTRK